MNWRAWIAAASALACAAPPLCAQTTGPTPTATTRPTPTGFHVSGTSVSTWQDDGTSVMSIDGPVVIRTDESVLRADDAVVWLQPVPGSPDAQRVGVALVGSAQIETGGATRSGDRPYVTTVVRGDVRFEAAQRVARDDSDAGLYRAATRLRDAERERGQQLEPAPDPTTQSTQPTVAAAPPPDPLADVPAGTSARISSPNPHLVVSDDDEVTYALPNVSIFYRWPDGSYVEMYAEHAVAFTGLKASDPKNRTPGAAEASLKAVYLEGDVRVLYVPVGDDRLGEQRLKANSCFFRMSDRSAVLTAAVLHTEDLKTGMPFVMRARTLKMLSEGADFEARGVQLTTSQFARPSFAIEASRIYVHRRKDEPARFRAANAQFKFIGVPLFWLPYAAGTATGRGAPIRDIAFERRDDYGLGVRTTWGLFESVGLEPPRALDAEYRLDYYTDRGPAGGLNAEYEGGQVDENTRQSTAFLGEADSYFVYEHGEDNLGANRLEVDPGYKEMRGVAGFRHQHFFPDGWHLQTQSWYVSDPTFLEEWKPYDRQFREGGPRATELYLKRQIDNRAFTFLLSAQPNDFVTTSDLQQEQFEVERLPEVGYHRVGDGLGGFATFYSDNLVSGLRHNVSEASLLEQGFTGAPASTPGIPSLGTTGIAEDQVWRGDFRQEVQFPFDLGPVRAVPYVVGRYTPYSEGVGGSAVSRVLGGVGTRFTTSFFRVFDNAHSELLDIHRMRHVLQPELHLFAGAQNVDRNEVFIFDEPIDDVSDLSAVNVALRQRWQTKRGGPGRWHSTDVFTLNLEGSFFRNRPPEANGFAGLPAGQRPPDDFRGVFYYTMPEASIPRNTLSVDGSWRLSDSTVVVGDAQYNLNANVLATAAVGVNVAREDRVRYYAGLRYIEPFNSNILTLALDYQLTPKYLLSVNQSYDFGEGENVTTGFTVTRRFDRFWMQVSTTVDRRTEERTVSFNFIPEGLPVSSATVQDWVPQQ